MPKSRGLWRRFLDYCRARENRTLFSMALAGVLVVGFLDFITGYQISFFLFYTGPIFFAVWFLDRKQTILIVLISALVWWWADWKAGHLYFASWVQIYETLTRLVFFGFSAMGARALKERRDTMETRLAAMRRMRDMEREILAAGERERQRIGLDLHDGLCQYLAGITCVTGSLRDDLAERFQPEAETAGELHELLKDAIVQARNIARGISPVHMDEAGLVSALEELVANTRHLHGVECRFEPEGDVLLEDREAATHLYRIAQEAISNAIRHGRAGHIHVTLSGQGGDLIMSIQDDGIGFDPANCTTTGMGMRAMKYRADLLGGVVDHRRVEGGHGTRVTCTIPTLPHAY